MEQNTVLGWDDEITKESEFTLLPEGEYNFKIVDLKRIWFEGSETTPACNRVIITIKVDGPGGKEVKLDESLLLLTKTEWLLSAFFTSIGLKKKGEPMRMNWNKVIGSTGRVKIGFREYKGEKYNTVKRWLSPEDNKPAATGGFKPGAF